MLVFERGDVVRLKSGGPYMTIKDADLEADNDEPVYSVMWFDTSGTLMEIEDIPGSVLEKRVS